MRWKKWHFLGWLNSEDVAANVPSSIREADKVRRGYVNSSEIPRWFRIMGFRIMAKSWLSSSTVLSLLTVTIAPRRHRVPRNVVVIGKWKTVR